MVRRFAAYGIVILAGVFVVSLGVAAAVRAQSASDITSDKLELIKDRCTNSQLAVQQIEKRDAVSRINRGRAYDQMIRQVSAFNSRFAYNKISSPDLIQLTSQIQSGVDTFRARYDKYDNDLTDAMKIDCKQKPADYYAMIIKAREDRSAVGDEVNSIVDLMGQYRNAIISYQNGAQ